jgi:urease accessory protein UreF
MPIALLLAMQASGMIIDWFGKNEQIRLGKMGAEVEQAGIESNIQLSRLETEQESLDAMVALRKNLGTQAAMLAARGTRSGQGTAALFGNESLSSFNSNEKMRRLNQMSREAALKAGKTISKLHQKTFENNTWNEFTKNITRNIPTSPEAYSQFTGSFGLTKIGG